MVENLTQSGSESENEDQEVPCASQPKIKSKLELLKEKALARIASRPLLDSSSNIIDLSTNDRNDTKSASDNKLDQVFQSSKSVAQSTNKKPTWRSFKAEIFKKLAKEREEGLLERKRQFNEDNELWSDHEEDCEDDEMEKTPDGEILDAETGAALGPEKSDDGYEPESEVDGDEAEDESDLSEEEENEVDEDPVDGECDAAHGECDLLEENGDGAAPAMPSGENIECAHSEGHEEVEPQAAESCGSADSLSSFSDYSQSQPIDIVPDEAVIELVMADLFTKLTDPQIFQILCEFTGFKTEGPSVYEEILESRGSEPIRRPRKRQMLVDSDDEDDVTIEKRAKTTERNLSNEGDTNDDLYQVDDSVDHMDITAPVEKPTRVVIEGEEEEQDLKAAKTFVETLNWTTELDDDVDGEERPVVKVGLPSSSIMDAEKAVGGILDDEAALSGSDVGSDIDDEEDDMDEYVEMEGDKDEIDMEEVRHQNMKTFIKLSKNEDDKAIGQIKEDLNVDQVASDSWDRSFRLRLRGDVDLNVSELLGEVEEQDEEGDDPVVPVEVLGRAGANVLVAPLNDFGDVAPLDSADSTPVNVNIRSRNSLIHRF